MPNKRSEKAPRASLARASPARTASPAAPSRRVLEHADGKLRCAWCGVDPLYMAYHDEEWGRPLHDDARLFEMLCLEGAQAGLSWITVLRKRAAYRAAFHGFDAGKMAAYGARDRRRLLNDPGIVRNRLKIQAFIGNARAYLAVREREGDFARLLWGFVDHRVTRRRPDGRTCSPQSDDMSRELKRRGFKFVGTTICYAFMQAVGMVDDHQRGCWVARTM